MPGSRASETVETVCNSTPTIPPAPPAPGRQISTWAGRYSRRVGLEGKQRVRNQPMAVAVWARQTASSVAETEEWRIAVSKDGAKRAVAIRARRRRKALKAAGAPGGLE